MEPGGEALLQRIQEVAGLEVGGTAQGACDFDAGIEPRPKYFRAQVEA